MSDNEFADILRSIESKLTDVWGAIDGIRAKMADTEVRQTAKIAKLEVYALLSKWAIGLVLSQFVGLAFWYLRQG